jgi:hypothetical protein
MQRPDATPKTPGPSKGAKKLTDADRIAILRRVKALRATGMLRSEAIEACGTNYYLEDWESPQRQSFAPNHSALKTPHNQRLERDAFFCE